MIMDKCQGTDRPTEIRSCGGNGSKGFGKKLGKCTCGSWKFVKNGRIYPHNIRI